MTATSDCLAQPSASDGPDIAHLLTTAHHHALQIATLDVLEDVQQLFIATHFSTLIRQGCTPQEIAVMLPAHDDIQTIVKTLATSSIREHAFGKLVASLGLLLRDARHSVATPRACSIDALTLSALISILSIEAQHKPDFSQFAFDHVPLFDYIEDQKQHGALVDDPAWEYDYTLNKNHQWKRAVDKSIVQATQAFIEASHAIDWQKQLNAGGDLTLLTSIDLDELTTLFVDLAPKSKANEEEPVPLPRPEGFEPDAPEPQPEADTRGLSVKETIATGSACRGRLLALCKRVANQAFVEQRYHQAEGLYGIIDDATNGERDPSILLNRAAALLKLDRFDETIQASSQALELLSARSDAKSRDLAWKGYLRRGSARKTLAQAAAAPSQRAELLASARTDFEEALKIDPKDATAQSELDALRTDANDARSNDVAASETAKAGEKTILESPFFRSDLVTGLLADTLRGASFPLTAIMKLLSPTVLDSNGEQRDEHFASEHQAVLQTITPTQQAHLQESIKHIGVVLALPRFQSQPTTLNGAVQEARWKLLTTSLRLLMGCSTILLNAVVKAQSYLEFVSDALRPDGKSTKRTNARTVPSSSSTHRTDLEQIELLLSQVQGNTLGMLECCCRLQGKKQEAEKFQRWYSKWWHGRAQRQGVEHGSVAWFVWMVERLNEEGQMRSA